MKRKPEEKDTFRALSHFDKMLAISLQNLSLSYYQSESKNELKVLSNISVDVREGEFVTILGPSGCGKTTLLKVIAGLLSLKTRNVIMDGCIKIFGMPPARAKQKRMFAITFQNPVLLPWRSVKENVKLPLEIFGGQKVQDLEFVDQMLDLLGIKDFSNVMPDEISGGMQQRVNLARALIQHPKILLMDEPFSGLDEITREKLNFELLKIHRCHKYTIIFITHNVAEAVLLGDRLLILSERPASIIYDYKNSLPKKRTKDILFSHKFIEIVKCIRKIISSGEIGQ